MKKYDIVLWDTDGTILDSKRSILNSVEWTAKKMGLRKISDEELESFFGPPALTHFMKVYDVDEKIGLEMLQIFRDRYNEIELFNAKPFDGVLDTMAEIKNRGYKQGIATYKSEPSLSRLMSYFEFDKVVDCFCGGADEKGKTKTDIMEECLKKLNYNDSNREKILMIGDSKHDYNGAKEVGCDFLGVNYGVGFDDMSENERNSKMCIGFCGKANEVLDYL